jgi:hypothetical protein
MEQKKMMKSKASNDFKKMSSIRKKIKKNEQSKNETPVEHPQENVAIRAENLTPEQNANLQRLLISAQTHSAQKRTPDSPDDEQLDDILAQHLLDMVTSNKENEEPQSNNLIGLPVQRKLFTSGEFAKESEDKLLQESIPDQNTECDEEIYEDSDGFDHDHVDSLLRTSSHASALDEASNRFPSALFLRRTDSEAVSCSPLRDIPFEKEIVESLTTPKTERLSLFQPSPFANLAQHQQPQSLADMVTHDKKNKKSKSASFKARTVVFTANLKTFAPEFVDTVPPVDVPLLCGKAEKFLELLSKQKFVKWVFGQLEEGEENRRPHIQGMASAVNAIHWGMLGTSHRESCKSPLDSIRYCSKPEGHLGGPWEFGNRPTWNIKGQKLLNQQLLNGDITKLVQEERLGWRDFKKAREFVSLFNILQQQQRPPVLDRKPVGVWYYGEPGVGKTYKVLKEIPYDQIYLKAQNKWWCGYDRQPHVLLDDFDRQGVCLGHYLKIWADAYRFTAETKGGTISVELEKFIITSNYTPEELFTEDDALCKAIRRRFRVIKLVRLKNTTNKTVFNEEIIENVFGEAVDQFESSKDTSLVKSSDLNLPIQKPPENPNLVAEADCSEIPFSKESTTDPFILRLKMNNKKN